MNRLTDNAFALVIRKDLDQGGEGFDHGWGHGELREPVPHGDVI